MATRIKLTDGTELLVQATVDDLLKALHAATETAAAVKIEQPDGTVVAITPQAVQTLREEPAAEAGLEEHFALPGAR